MQEIHIFIINEIKNKLQKAKNGTYNFPRQLSL